MAAAAIGHVNLLRFLRYHGAGFNAADIFGETALMYATKNQQLDAVDYLVSCGSNVNATNSKGETAFRLAVSRGYQDIQRILWPVLQPSWANQRGAEASSTLGRGAERALISPLELELMSCIHNGNIIDDYRAKWLDADVVVKLSLSDGMSSAFEEEWELLAKLRHPNVIKLYGVCQEAGLQLFVSEYASWGLLSDFIHIYFTPIAWRYLHQAALGLEYLHERKIVHGNLRCGNIMIGSDGLAKLSNLRLGGLSRTLEQSRSRAAVEAIRWKSPEQMHGEQISLSADIYSLGMCILEVETHNAPWGPKDKVEVAFHKSNWTPESPTGNRQHEPPGLGQDTRELVEQMCARDPGKRPSIATIVYKFEQLADAALRSNSDQPDCEALYRLDDHLCGETVALWARVERAVSDSGNVQHLYALEELTALHQRLQVSKHPRTLLARFHDLLLQFHSTVMTMQSAERARILQLSSTRATANSFRTFNRRIDEIWRILDESSETKSERAARRIHLRNQQIEFFVSEVTKTWMVLNELETEEERAGFLAFLEEEIEDHGSNYSDGQIAVMREAHREASSHFSRDMAIAVKPEWFVPWYELAIDKWSLLGEGGFGSVHRAKWLDSDVVVKQVNVAGEDETPISVLSLASSVSASIATLDSATRQKRVEAMEMFKREADIWFGLSHPHVVRLFGACHVGTPFFVCEYATKGTLVKHIREHPGQMWRLLYEAALGVLYLHARNVVHGDLKGNNIVIGSDGKAKVTDFGLSSIASHTDASNSKITGAWHWVAPECLVAKDARPTFASDVYSLGMCIVEALRVVEAAQHEQSERNQPPLPWQTLDNIVVKAHVSMGRLPARPRNCTDEQWTLVTRMCCHDPHQRIKMMTVVDELALLAKETGAARVSEATHLVDVNSESATDGSSSPVKADPEAFEEMKLLLTRQRSHVVAGSSSIVALFDLYTALWARLEEVHAEVAEATSDCSLALERLVESARAASLKLEGTNNTLVDLTEKSLRGYTLHRRLDKLIAAHFLRASDFNRFNATVVQVAAENQFASSILARIEEDASEDSQLGAAS